MSKKLKATCNECGEVFNVKFRENKRPNGVIERTFKCPECNHVYFVSATNKPIRKLHERMDFMRKKLGAAFKRGDVDEMESLNEQIDEAEDESKRLMEALREKLQGGGK